MLPALYEPLQVHGVITHRTLPADAVFHERNAELPEPAIATQRVHREPQPQCRNDLRADLTHHSASTRIVVGQIIAGLGWELGWSRLYRQCLRVARGRAAEPVKRTVSVRGLAATSECPKCARRRTRRLRWAQRSPHKVDDRMVDWRGGFRRGPGRGHRRHPGDRHRTCISPPAPPLGATNGRAADAGGRTSCSAIIWRVGSTAYSIGAWSDQHESGSVLGAGARHRCSGR